MAEIQKKKPAETTAFEKAQAQRREMCSLLGEKCKALEEILAQDPRSIEDVRSQSRALEEAQFSIEQLEREIDALDDELLTMTAMGMSEQRGAILKEAEALAKEKKKLVARIAEIDAAGQKLREEFEMNLPRKRVQTSSQCFLKWEKDTEEVFLESFTLRGDPVPGKRTRHDESKRIQFL